MMKNTTKITDLYFETKMGRKVDYISALHELDPQSDRAEIELLVQSIVSQNDVEEFKSINKIIGDSIFSINGLLELAAGKSIYNVILDGMNKIPSKLKVVGEKVKASANKVQITDLCMVPKPKHDFTVKVKIDGKEVNLGRQHYIFPLVLKLLSVRIGDYRPNIALVGPAGSGKSSMARVVAKALNVECRATAFCSQSTKTDLLGFIDARGVYQGTAFRHCYENGGVWLADELDAANANVTVIMNDAVANGSMSFPDGVVKRNPNFVLMAGMNTWGNGATREFIGRNALDAATLDRFLFIHLPYDEGFEAHLCGIEGKFSPAINLEEGGIKTPEQWLAYVSRVRQNAEKHSIKHVVTPRASMAGCQLSRASVGSVWLERILLWKGLDKPTIDKLK